MKLDEKGYTLIELIIAITIMVLVSGAAGAAIFQIIRNIERNSDHITAVRQVHNAGYWISRDAQMADDITTADDLTSPDFLKLNWTEFDDDNNPTYHSATYFFEGLTDDIGKVKRNHWSSAGADEDTLIAEHIYYAPGDPDDTTEASYETSLLTVQITALVGDERETKEYRIKRRPNI